MKLELTYIIQALDNVSPNIIEQNGKLLNPEVQLEDMVRRQCTSKASEISLNGHKEIYGKSLRVFYTNSDFLIEVITEQFDNAGRMVPVVVYGHFPEHNQDWMTQLKEDIKRFLSSDEIVTSTVKKITIKSDVYDLITEKMGEIWLKKKSSESPQKSRNSDSDIRYSSSPDRTHSPRNPPQPSESWFDWFKQYIPGSSNKKVLPKEELDQDLGNIPEKDDDWID